MLFSKQERNAMKGLPWGWKRTIQRSNLFRARRELAEFLRFANRDAEAQGGQITYKTEFVDGWHAFAANPCYETAVSFIKGAPEYAPKVFVYFESSCPGGPFIRRGLTSAMGFALDNYRLDRPHPPGTTLRELTHDEYRVFPRHFVGEAIYHAPPAEFVGHRWDVMIGMINERPYKLAAFLRMEGWEEADPIIEAAFKRCDLQLGTPSEERQGLYVWDTEDGNVILQTTFIADSIALNIYVTSGEIRNMKTI